MGTSEPARPAVRVRAILDDLPAYRPGRRAPDGTTIKLSSNESPDAPLPGVIARAGEALAAANRYPDNDSSDLAAALASHHGVGTDQVAVGCGSVVLCQQIVNAVAGPGDEVAYGWRSFEAYPILATLAGASSVQVPLAAHALDVDALARQVGEATRVVFVCNPNNPTGTALSGEALFALIDAVPPDCLVVVDEAYREYVTDRELPDAPALLAAGPNVAVLRTFSKAYGLAGLRVGYALGSPSVIGALRRTQVPFGVNVVAQAAALASLEVRDELAARVRAVVAERTRVRAALLAGGYEVPDSQANFVWLPLGEDAAAFAASCAERGVLVRPFPGEGVRVTVGSPAENDAFLAAVMAP
ncbi:MAG TPA: histidinol-phosphate transaminase [Acidimicrobiales bacterium]|nr:histidinol-phosphate transaminase [Acidimicrobiales bacterium]